MSIEDYLVEASSWSTLQLAATHTQKIYKTKNKQSGDFYSWISCESLQ